MAWCLSSSTPSSSPWPSTRQLRWLLRWPGHEGAHPALIVGIAGPALVDIFLHQRDARHLQQQSGDQDRRQDQPPHMAGGKTDDKKSPPQDGFAEIVGMARPSP